MVFPMTAIKWESLLLALEDAVAYDFKSSVKLVLDVGETSILFACVYSEVINNNNN
jgi:hypothetical protein